MPDTINNIISGASIKVLVASFVLGGIYFEFREMKSQQDILEQRLSKKIKVLNDLEKRIRNLENCN